MSPGTGLRPLELCPVSESTPHRSQRIDRSNGGRFLNCPSRQIRPRGARWAGADRQPVGNPTREVDGQVFSEPRPAKELTRRDRGAASAPGRGAAGLTPNAADIT